MNHTGAIIIGALIIAGGIALMGHRDFAAAVLFTFAVLLIGVAIWAQMS